MSVNYEKRYQELKETFRLEYQSPPSLLHFLEKDVWTHTGLNPESEIKILELGCGAGSLFNEKYKRPKVVSLDLAPTALSMPVNIRIKTISFICKVSGEEISLIFQRMSLISFSMLIAFIV